MPDHRPILTLSFRTEQPDFLPPASLLRSGRPAQRGISLLFAFIPSPHPHSGSDRRLSRFRSRVRHYARPNCLVGRSFSSDIKAHPNPIAIPNGAGRFFPSRFAPANRSACAERNLSSLCIHLASPDPVGIVPVPRFCSGRLEFYPDSCRGGGLPRLQPKSMARLPSRAKGLLRFFH